MSATLTPPVLAEPAPSEFSIRFAIPAAFMRANRALTRCELLADTDNTMKIIDASVGKLGPAARAVAIVGAAQLAHLIDQVARTERPAPNPEK